MRIDNISMSSSIYHGLWTTVWFHVSSVDDIVNASNLLMTELKSRYKELPNHVSVEKIKDSITKIFQTTSLNDISEANFQLDYMEAEKKIIVGVDWGQISNDNYALFHIVTDSSGNFYKEILMNNREKIRVTLVKDSWEGANGIRIQIREPSGHLRQGPEIPSEYIDELIKELKSLKRYGH